MKSSIYVKRQSFEVRLNSVISFVFIAFCQPRILRYSARDVTDIFAIKKAFSLCRLTDSFRLKTSFNFLQQIFSV